jgi:hypothetical protein
MAIGANSLIFAVLRLPAGSALRAAMRGSVPATTKYAGSVAEDLRPRTWGISGRGAGRARPPGGEG